MDHSARRSVSAARIAVSNRVVYLLSIVMPKPRKLKPIVSPRASTTHAAAAGQQHAKQLQAKQPDSKKRRTSASTTPQEGRAGPARKRAKPGQDASFVVNANVHVSSQPHDAQNEGRPPHHHQRQQQQRHQQQGRQKQQLLCHSIVDRQAAKAMQALLAADAGEGKGATLKALTLAPHISAKKATYAVTCQAMKYLSTLQNIVESSKLMKQPRLDQMSIHTAYILVYELLLGEGLQRNGLAERLVLKHKGQLQAALDSLLQEAGVQSAAELLESHKGSDSLTPPSHPRWVRVNTLKMTVEEALQQLQDSHPEVTQDPLLPDLLRLPPGTSLFDHLLVASGALVLQGKSSCMPAHALSPQPGWHCVDCCAAPGNKTTHVAALLKGRGRVDAFDKDARRLARLQNNVQLTGSHKVIHAHQADFLTVDTQAAQYADVRGVILDPSCSGSGTIVGRQDHLLPSWKARLATLQALRQQHQQLAAGASQQQTATGMSQDVHGSMPPAALSHVDEEEMTRVQQLAKFQVSVLRHALTFPKLERLVYSTCSIHPEENELVVQEVLPEAQELGFTLQEVFPSWPRRGLPFFPGCEKMIRTDPFEDETDGFFVAVFGRTSSDHLQGSPLAAAQVIEAALATETADTGAHKAEEQGVHMKMAKKGKKRKVTS